MRPPPIRATQVKPANDIAGPVWRVFKLFVALTCVAVAIFIAGTFLSPGFFGDGDATSSEELQIVIGNDAYHIPANMIRKPEQRVQGLTNRVDLSIYWPSKSGFTQNLTPQFGESDPAKVDIVLVSLSRVSSLLSMADRYWPVYTKAIDLSSATKADNGLTYVPLMAEFGYVDEMLVYKNPLAEGVAPEFVARCQTKAPTGDPLLLACETDMLFADSTEINVRFPEHYLNDWQTFSASLLQFADQLRMKP